MKELADEIVEITDGRAVDIDDLDLPEVPEIPRAEIDEDDQPEPLATRAGPSGCRPSGSSRRRTFD